MNIRNARLGAQLVDILIQDGVIASIIPAIGGVHSGDIDAAGRVVLPGFWDEHVHLGVWAQHATRADVLSASKASEVITIMSSHVVPEGAPIIGTGLRYALWPEQPTRHGLDAVSVERPVVVFSMDVHSCWINTAAAREYGVETLVGDDGILREQDCFDLLTRLAQIPAHTMDDLIDRVARKAASQGIVGVTSFEMEDLHNWERRVASGFDAIRVAASVYPDRLQDAIAAGWKTGDTIAGAVTMGYLKVISDGAINTRTACCHDAYPDGSGHGVMNIAQDELVAAMTMARDAGIESAIHAIGDAANTHVIDAFETVGIGGRIEHAQMVLPGDIARMAKLGIIASVQPKHAVDDRDVADELWKGRDWAYPMSSLLDAGVPVYLGSDAPVAPLDPWLSIECAVTRTADDRESWHPEQSLTVDEALRCSTRSTIEPGQPADLILVDRDPRTCPPHELHLTTVALTMLAGRVTHTTIG